MWYGYTVKKQLKIYILYEGMTKSEKMGDGRLGI